MINKNILVAIKELNIEIIEWLNKLNLGIELDYFSFPENLNSDKLENSIEEYNNLLKLVKNEISMHGAFYDLNPIARDPKIVEVAQFRILQSIEIANKLNIKHIVFHANFVDSTYKNYKEFWVKKQVKFWKYFIDILELNNVTIYIENTREHDASFINEILEKIDNKHFKACFDTGHSNCFTNSKIKPSEWVKNYANNLGYIHLHSNSGKTDEHIAFTKGNIDFSNFFEEISKLKSKPFIIIEVKTKEDIEISLNKLEQISIYNNQ